MPKSDKTVKISIFSKKWNWGLFIRSSCAYLYNVILTHFTPVNGFEIEFKNVAADYFETPFFI